jgi:DNA ligase-1
MELIMKTPWQIIAELESDNSRLAKEAIVKREAEAGNTVFFEGVKQALDSMITFGIRQVEEKKGDGKGITADRFWEVAGQLASRELSGDAARNAVAYLRMNAKEQEWNQWYRRILIKDLRCGVSEKTINSVVGKINESYSVPVFTCQLAHDGANHESKVSGKKLVEVKLDGVRVLTIVYPNGTCNMFSRNGKELVNFPHVIEQISKHASFFATPVVLDGEVMSASFQDLMKQVHRKSDVQSNDAVLNLFDILTLDEFRAGKGAFKQTERSQALLSWYTPLAEHMPNVSVVGQELVDLATQSGKDRFKAINAQAIAGGYEGIMIKDPNAYYETKRSVAWLKQKPFIEVSLTVVGLEEGTGKNAGRLGALVCEGIDDGVTIRTNVGSGLTDALRDQIWTEGEASIVGQVVEIRADAKTRNQDSEEVYSLRFPRFLRFRGFEAGEKI